MNKDKFEAELDKIGGQKFPVEMTGAMIIYILQTLKEKSIGLMIKRELGMEADEGLSVEKTNAIVGSVLLDQAVKLLGKDILEEYFGKGCTDPVAKTESGAPKVRKDLH